MKELSLSHLVILLWLPLLSTHVINELTIEPACFSVVFSAAGAWWWRQQGGTVNNHHTSVWMGEIMSAQLKVSLHQAATQNHSSSHRSPFCFHRGRTWHRQKGGQEKCASFCVWMWIRSQVWPWSLLMFWGLNSFHMLIWYTPTQCNMY